MADNKVNTIDLTIDATKIRGLVRDHIESLSLMVNGYDQFTVHETEIRNGNYEQDNGINVSVALKFQGE